MKKKYLTLLAGALIYGCNSNGTAPPKTSTQLPWVIKSVASSVNKAKVGDILGAYVRTFLS